MGRFLYRFPNNAQAERNTVGNQILKLDEELNEVAKAWACECGSSNDRLIEEVLDLIQTAEGVLRKFDESDVLRCYWTVLKKCGKRGDYERAE